MKKILRLTGHELLLKRLKKAGDQSLNAEECSPTERQVIAMIKTLRSNASLTLLDQPLAEGGNKLDSKTLLKAILRSRREDETVVMTLRKPVGLKYFDRIVVMKKGGKISFEGDYEAWRVWRSGQQSIEEITT